MHVCNASASKMREEAETGECWETGASEPGVLEANNEEFVSNKMGSEARYPRLFFDLHTWTMAHVCLTLTHTRLYITYICAHTS